MVNLFLLFRSALFTHTSGRFLGLIQIGLGILHLIPQLPYLASVLFETAETAIKTPLVYPLIGSEYLCGFVDLDHARFQIIQDLTDVIGDIPTSQDVLFKIKLGTHLANSWLWVLMVSTPRSNSRATPENPTVATTSPNTNPTIKFLIVAPLPT
jgi:hypothetical protein